MPTDPQWDLPQDVDAGWERMAPIKPRGYVSYFTGTPPVIDGRLDDPAWRDDVWTAPFVDIEGSRKPAPRYTTRAAIRWDDDNLYIAAYLEEPHVWGTLTQRNSVLFQDNDFEVFIDPDGDNHNYYELEINALNTIWELSLEKPYRDGGPVHSPMNLPGLRTAVHINGSLNAPHHLDLGWTLEVAIPWSDLERFAPNGVPPVNGEYWRINFSRVEWDHEIVDGAYRKLPNRPEHNWVWSPQGVVDMHRPERWGIVQFSRAAPGEEAFRPDPTLPVRDALMALYYAQQSYRREHGKWATELAHLRSHLSAPARILEESSMAAADNGFTITLEAACERGVTIAASVDHTSGILVRRSND